VCLDFKGFIFYFTDGSKNDKLVGSAFITAPNICQGFKLNALSSVFTAELFAICKALEHICNRPEKSFLICSDSLSSLQAIDTLYSPLFLVQGIHSLLASLSSKGVRVVFCWVPGHVGIQGNELADKAAKEATEKIFIDNDKLPFNDLQAFFKSRLKSNFQIMWDLQEENKLKTIKQCVESWDSSIRPNRREEVVLTRLRIGHTLLTHSFLFTDNKIPPRCDTCNEILSVKHFLIDCSKYRVARQHFSLAGTLDKVLMDNCRQIDKLFKFLVETGILKQM
jgi:ribonuclease HI